MPSADFCYTESSYKEGLSNMMDINYELYKVFYYVAISLSFFRCFETAVYLPVGRQPVDQSARKETGNHTVYPKHQTGTADPGRRDAASPHRTGNEPDQARGSAAHGSQQLRRRSASHRRQ